jgi:hypothetical protein
MAERKRGWAYFRECALIFILGVPATFAWGWLTLWLYDLLHG